jgi:hypothetical protein
MYVWRTVHLEPRYVLAFCLVEELFKDLYWPGQSSYALPRRTSRGNGKSSSRGRPVVEEHDRAVVEHQSSQHLTIAALGLLCKLHTHAEPPPKVYSIESYNKSTRAAQDLNACCMEVDVV